MTWRFKVSGDEELKKAFKEIEQAIAQEALLEAAQAGISVITPEVKALASKISSRLAADVEEQVRRTKGGKASATVGYRGKAFPIAATMAFEYGSGLFGTRNSKYPIERKDKSPLSFVAGGARVARPRVEHPGIQARPTIRPAYDKKKREATAAAMRVLEQKLMRIGK